MMERICKYCGQTVILDHRLAWAVEDQPGDRAVCDSSLVGLHIPGL